MTGRWFVDTNVFVYDHDSTEPAKQAAVRLWIEALWSQRLGATSMQVLNEYYHAVTRRLTPGLTDVVAWYYVSELLLWTPRAIDEEVLRQAWLVRDRFRLSWWDCLIVAAARLQQCDFLLTEDLQDGQDLGGVMVVDPFAHDPSGYA